jgi:hypothetical protein
MNIVVNYNLIASNIYGVVTYAASEYRVWAYLRVPDLSMLHIDIIEGRIR